MKLQVCPESWRHGNAVAVDNGSVDRTIRIEKEPRDVFRKRRLIPGVPAVGRSLNSTEALDEEDAEVRRDGQSVRVRVRDRIEPIGSAVDPAVELTRGDHAKRAGRALGDGQRSHLLGAWNRMPRVAIVDGSQHAASGGGKNAVLSTGGDRISLPDRGRAPRAAVVRREMDPGGSWNAPDAEVSTHSVGSHHGEEVAPGGGEAGDRGF